MGVAQGGLQRGTSKCLVQYRQGTLDTIVQVLHANLPQTKTRFPQRDGHGAAGHFLVTGSVTWQMCMEYRTKELPIANSTRNGWLAGSSVLAVGLTWRECIPLVLAGGLCNAIAIGKFHCLVDAIYT